MKQFLLLTIFFFLTLIIYAQTPSIQWQKAIGGTSIDDASSIIQTTDGGYAVIGYSYSNNGDVTGNHGNNDYLLVKLNSIGAIQWQRCFGGTGDDRAKSIQQTSDGGYIVAGYSGSNDGNVTGNHGATDYWLVKIDNNGVIQWQQSYGGSADDWALSIQQTTDGGYIISGVSSSNDGDVTGNHGSLDCWIMKISNSGMIQWQKSYGGTNAEWGEAVQQTIDGGYIVAGQSDSNDGDITGNHGSYDYFVLKLNSSGVVQWQKSFGGTSDDYDVYSIQQTKDHGYILSGSSLSIDGDITLHYSGYDYWILKLDSLGSIQWQKSFGGTSDDYGNFIRQTTDGGYIVAGQTSSSNIDFTGNHGTSDFGIIKLDSFGIVKWTKCLGGTGNDWAEAIQQTTDEGYIVAGFSGSNDGDVTGNHNGGDCWIVKLSPVVGIEDHATFQSINVFPNPNNGKFNFCCLDNENTVNIFDITGRLIYQTLCKEDICNIDLIREEKGLYFYRIINQSNEIKQGKIIIR